MIQWRLYSCKARSQPCEETAGADELFVVIGSPNLRPIDLYERGRIDFLPIDSGYSLVKTELIDLRNILVILYSDVSTIRRVLGDAGLTAARIEFTSNATNIWYSALHEAEKLGQIETLLRVAEGDYGTNEALQLACAAYRRLTGPPLHNTQSHGVNLLPGSEPLMNCVNEIAAFHELLNHEQTTQRAIVLQGGHGCGKSRLLREYRRLAESRQRKVIGFDLSRQLTIEHCLERIVDNCAEPARFTAFDQSLRKKKPESLNRQADWHEELTHAFFTDLRGQRTATPLFIFFDHLEKSDHPLRNWLLDKFVMRLADRPLLTVLAGHAELERVQHLEWVRFFTPKIPQIEHFYEYASHYEVQLEPANMNALFTAFQASPKSFVDYINALRLQQQGQPV